MARVGVLTIYPPVDTVATREDAERGRLLRATARAGLQRPSLPVLLQLVRLDLARPVRPRLAAAPAAGWSPCLWRPRGGPIHLGGRGGWVAALSGPQWYAISV